MDPGDRLEEDFKFYLSFFKQNLKELRNEKDKALCQEWLQRLEGMRETRKQRRDRNVYLSQLALAMAEGQLCAPFNAPPPRQPLPLPASVFGLYQTGVAVPEEPRKSQSEMSSYPSRADTSIKYWPNVAIGTEKGKWDINTKQAPEEIVPEEPQTNQYEMSSYPSRADISEKYWPNVAIGTEKGKWDINTKKAPEENMPEKPRTSQSEMSSYPTRPDNSGKYWTNVAVGTEKGKWNINTTSATEEIEPEEPQTIQSEMSSNPTRPNSSRKYWPNLAIETEKVKWGINGKSAPEEIIQMLEEPQTSRSEMSIYPTTPYSSGKYRPNIAIGTEKGKWNICTKPAPEEIMPEEPQASQSEISLYPTRAENSGKYWPNVAIGTEKGKRNIYTKSVPEEMVSKKTQTNQSEMSSYPTGAGTSRKYWPHVTFVKEKSKSNINRVQAAGEIMSLDSQSSLSQLSSFGTISDKSVDQLSENIYSDDGSNSANGIQLKPEVSQNQQTLLLEIPLFRARVDTSSEQLSETSNEEGNNEFPNDKSLHADEFDSRKPQTLQSAVPPSISSSDLSEERLPKTVDRSDESNPSNETLLIAGEAELHSANLIDSQTEALFSEGINPVKNLKLQQPELHSTNISGSWTKMIPKTKFHSKKNLDLRRPELQSSNLSYYRSCVLSKDKLNSEKNLDFQQSEPHSTNFSGSRTNVFSKAKFKPEIGLDLQQPVLSRTCPRPSQMPIAEEGLESQSPSDEFVTSQWAKIVKQDKDVCHANSFESLLSYSKGQWLDESCDSESFKSAFSVPSVTSAGPSEINRQSDSTSVHSEPRQQIRRSEVEIQSLSLQSLREQSRKSTPALSVSSVLSTGEQKDSPVPRVQNGQDQFTQTQSEHLLPQEKNLRRKPMLLPVYVVSADQQPIVLYTPVQASQIEGHQLIIPTTSQLSSASQQSQQQ